MNLAAKQSGKIFGIMYNQRTNPLFGLHPETGHLGILQNFTNAVLYGEHLLAPGEEGINGLTLSNAAYLSTWMDEWVLLPFEEEMFCRMLEERQAKEIPQRKLSIQENMTGEYIERWAVRW